MANSYQRRADESKRNRSYREAKEEAKKIDFPRWIDYAPKSDMDKYKQQPWYDSDIFRRSSDDGDPFDKTTERGIKGGFNPEYKWIQGRQKQMEEQSLESFRKALMNVSKNKVRTSGLYWNAKNNTRGILT